MPQYQAVGSIRIVVFFGVAYRPNLIRGDSGHSIQATPISRSVGAEYPAPRGTVPVHDEGIERPEVLKRVGAYGPDVVRGDSPHGSKFAVVREVRPGHMAPLCAVPTQE